MTDLNITSGNTNAVESNSGTTGVEFNVDATSGKLAYNSGGPYAQINSGTVITIPIYAEGDEITVSNHKYNCTYVSIGGTALESNTTLTTHIVTSDEAGNGYVEITVDYIGESAISAYICSITLETTGYSTDSGSVTATWDLGSGSYSSITFNK